MKINQWRIGEKYWKKSHNCFFCKIVHPDCRREDRRLDPNRDKAEEIRCEIVTSIKKQGSPSPDYGVRDLCNLFLDYAKANNALKTYKGYRCFLKSFISTIPATLKIRDFKLHHVQNWLKRKYPSSGNQNTRRDAIVALKRVFNWAVNDMEYLDRNPIHKLKRPAAVPRTACLSKEQWATVLSHFSIDDPFYSFLQFMLYTGCRPQEARIIEAKHIDWQAMKVSFKDGEVPGKKGSRDILLTTEAMAILKKWALKYPKGPVLRNEDGNPWKIHALNSRLYRLKNKLSFRAHCYLARHSVATDMLEAGASAGAVAAVLGHKDATMVLKVYGKHIDRREQHLRDCLKKATN